MITKEFLENANVYFPRTMRTQSAECYMIFVESSDELGTLLPVKSRLGRVYLFYPEKEEANFVDIFLEVELDAPAWDFLLGRISHRLLDQSGIHEFSTCSLYSMKDLNSFYEFDKNG